MDECYIVTYSLVYKVNIMILFWVLYSRQITVSSYYSITYSLKSKYIRRPSETQKRLSLSFCLCVCVCVCALLFSCCLFALQESVMYISSYANNLRQTRKSALNKGDEQKDLYIECFSIVNLNGSASTQVVFVSLSGLFPERRAGVDVFVLFDCVCLIHIIHCTYTLVENTRR